MDVRSDFINAYGWCRPVAELMTKLDDIGFFNAPASTKFHGAYEGGLYDHSAAVTESLVELTNALDLRWEREESPIIVGLLHDLCKCDQYRINKADLWEHVENTPLKGHGEKSVMIASTLLQLTEEEMMCIRYHMGAFNEADPSLYSNAVKRYPNVLWTHTADMYASQVRGI